MFKNIAKTLYSLKKKKNVIFGDESLKNKNFRFYGEKKDILHSYVV